MVATLSRLAIAAAIAATFSGPSFAQKLPADCSAAAVPAQPVEVSIVGVKFAPKSIKLRAAGDVTSGDENFDSYRLSLSNEDNFSPPLEADMTVLLRKGQRVDGKMFRRLPTKETDKQPSPTPGLPEVQGWSLKNRPAQVDLSSVSYIGSLRVEFGKRQGNSINGKVYLCVAKGQTTMFVSTPTKEDSYAIGTFQARIE